MRILMPLGCYYPWVGGAEVFAQKLAECLADRGDEVEVVTGRWADKEVKEEEEIGGVRVRRVEPMTDVRFLKTLGWIWPGYRESLKILEIKDKQSLSQRDQKLKAPLSGKEKLLDRDSSSSLMAPPLNDGRGISLMHAHIFPGMVVGALLKRRTDWPLLTTVQGGDLADYPETTGMGLGILTPMIGWSLRQADMVHAVSEYLAEKAKKLGAKKTIVVPNGVDTKVFRPGDKIKLRKKLGFSEDDLIIVSHSRLTPKNGLDLLIKAFSRIKNYELRIRGENKKRETRNLKLLIMGGGHQRGELEGLIRDLRLGETVTLAGEKPHREIPDYLAMGDGFCRPARDEGFGISFIEAMACGLPVVGTRVGGIPEVVDEGETGWLVESENEEEVVTALVRLLGDKELRKKMGEKGRKVAVERFGWERVLKRMEEVYQLLIVN
jgi:glycosyltransferase involved in cell wall biosynthesis